MTGIRRLAYLAFALTLVTAASQAGAQDINALPTAVPPVQQPPPPPPPRIEVPKVPQMDSVPSAPRAAAPRRKSYNKRVTDCIHEGSGGPADRANNSRACAN